MMFTHYKQCFIPLVNKMHELMMKESHIHCDETPVQVLNEPGKMVLRQEKVPVKLKYFI